MILDAVRSEYLPSMMKDAVRLTSEMCVYHVDMNKLKKVKKYTTSVSGELKEKWFQPLRWSKVTTDPAGNETRTTRDFLAEVVTGTLYDAETGYSSAPTLFIPEIADAHSANNGRVPGTHGNRPVGGQRSKSKFRQAK